MSYCIAVIKNARTNDFKDKKEITIVWVRCKSEMSLTPKLKMNF